MSGKKLQKRKGYEDIRPEILGGDSPFVYKEAYKKLRTNINFLSVNSSYKKIIITSAIPNEGKSSVAINLAATLAEKGEKVLLLDCDLRKPSIGQYIGNRKDWKTSLTDLLMGEVLPEKISIYRHPELNFSYIPCGHIPPNPAELLGSVRMKELLQSFGKMFDYVICDTPPVSVVTDAALLSSYCDGVLMVIRQKYTSKEQVRAAKQNLDAVHADIIGGVLNRYDIKGDIRDKSGRYGYYYEYKSGK
ncbi:CpsD/CapB family tyrosine-protein kinase [Novisyntrophococcus fermenticellae]|uniref:CpsD/CapB family tyrosine-protein kinase n=1 Tax=Novisyntrophococcus fermenticellae TaxID=2068655 RepID=UPI001E59E557|nr:CpsD/CapB family tyrosine-protein kinase [Novisyntrophococcus fermenticellae]